MSTMPQASVPIVYVETNWVVALALPHDRFHLSAVALFEDARAGACAVRLPIGAIHEGRARAKQEINTRPTMLTEILRLFENAALAGWNELDGVVAQLKGEAVRRYFQHNPQTVIDSLTSCACLTLIDDPRREHDKLVELRATFGLDYAKSFDRYVLSALLSDRITTDLHTPAIFCSINWRELKPSAAKGGLPSSVYEQARIYYSETFAWRDALPAWKGKFSKPSGT